MNVCICAFELVYRVSGDTSSDFLDFKVFTTANLCVYVYVFVIREIFK